MCLRKKHTPFCIFLIKLINCPSIFLCHRLTERKKNTHFCASNKNKEKTREKKEQIARFQTFARQIKSEKIHDQYAPRRKKWISCDSTTGHGSFTTKDTVSFLDDLLDKVPDNPITAYLGLFSFQKAPLCTFVSLINADLFSVLANTFCRNLYEPSLLPAVFKYLAPIYSYFFSLVKLVTRLNYF